MSFLSPETTTFPQIIATHFSFFLRFWVLERANKRILGPRFFFKWRFQVFGTLKSANRQVFANLVILGRYICHFRVFLVDIRLCFWPRFWSFLLFLGYFAVLVAFLWSPVAKSPKPVGDFKGFFNWFLPQKRPFYKAFLKGKTSVQKRHFLTLLDHLVLGGPYRSVYGSNIDTKCSFWTKPSTFVQRSEGPRPQNVILC